MFEFWPKFGKFQKFIKKQKMFFEVLESIEFIDEKKIKFILVSFDYKYDTPSVLKDLYEPSMDADTNLEVLSSTGYIEDIYQLVKQSGGDFWGVERGKIGHKQKSCNLLKTR